MKKYKRETDNEIKILETKIHQFELYEYYRIVEKFNNDAFRTKNIKYY